MPPRKLDLFTQARRQAEKALTLLKEEIQKTEAELKELLSQASAWRAALAGAGNSNRRGQGRPRRRGAGKRRTGGRATARPSAARGARRGNRIDWESVLSSVPSKFGVEDVIKHPGAKSKGRAQIYPALSRWLDAKKIKRIEKGRYQKL
jgi:hypothetical protein